MARKGLVESNKRRLEQIARFAEARKEIIHRRKVSRGDPAESFYWTQRLAELPRNSSPVRYRNRCALRDHGRGYLRYFGLCRHAVRELASRGQLPGFRKSSW